MSRTERDHRYNTSAKGKARSDRYRATHREAIERRDTRYRSTTAGILVAERAYQKRVRRALR